MGVKSPTERLNDLDKEFAAISERLKNTIKELDTVYKAYSELDRAVADWRLAYERESTLSRRDIDDLKNWKDDQKKDKDERTRSWWALTPNLTAAVITIILAPIFVLLWTYVISLIRHP
jgi:hypothetical protein